MNTITPDVKANKSSNVGIYAYYDTKALRFDIPFFAQNDLGAKRQYELQTSQDGTILNKFKQDFDLYRLGWYDQTTAKIEDDFEEIVVGKNLFKKDE